MKLVSAMEDGEKGGGLSGMALEKSGGSTISGEGNREE